MAILKLLPIYLKHFETSDLFLGNCFRPLAAKFRHSWVSDISWNCLACLIHFNPSRSIYRFGTWRQGLFGDLYNQFLDSQNSYEVLYTRMTKKMNIHMNHTELVGFPILPTISFHRLSPRWWNPSKFRHVAPQNFLTVSRRGIAGGTVEVAKVEKEFTKPITFSWDIP